MAGSVNKKEREYKYLVEIELMLVVISHQNGFGFLTEEVKVVMINLEARKRKILSKKEHESRMQSRATWLLCGDDNTPLFHKFANQRKNLNSIWKINDDGGKEVEGFKDIVGVAISHFETLFQADSNLNLTELLKISTNFPSSISDEENFDLMKPVTLERYCLFLSCAKMIRVLDRMGFL